MLGTIIMPVIRHGMTVAAGALVAKGYLDAGMTDTFIGFGLAGFALVMSYYDKAKSVKAVEAAKAK